MPSSAASQGKTSGPPVRLPRKSNFNRTTAHIVKQPPRSTVRIFYVVLELRGSVVPMQRKRPIVVPVIFKAMFRRISALGHHQGFCMVFLHPGNRLHPTGQDLLCRMLPINLRFFIRRIGINQDASQGMLGSLLVDLQNRRGKV